MMKINRRGDTLVEVLLATVILSLVMAGAFAISNRATQIGQNAVERSQVSNLLQEQVEVVRSMRDGGYSSWDAIVSRASSTSPNYDECETSNTDAFYIDLNPNVYSGGALDFKQSAAIAPFTSGASGSGDSYDDVFEVWLEAYQSGSFIELHARACWDQLGGDVRGQANAIYRLQDF